MRNSIRKIRPVILALALVSVAAAGYARARYDYQFKVHNNTKEKIVKVLASPDGKSYGNFDIGDGIAPGATVTLVWDKSTDNSNCEWFFKAVFDGGEESQPVKFDFCEKDLVLEFSE
jgi:hypothetical protein